MINFWCISIKPKVVFWVKNIIFCRFLADSANLNNYSRNLLLDHLNYEKLTNCKASHILVKFYENFGCYFGVKSVNFVGLLWILRYRKTTQLTFLKFDTEVQLLVSQRLLRYRRMSDELKIGFWVKNMIFSRFLADFEKMKKCSTVVFEIWFSSQIAGILEKIIFFVILF